jgi:hypothetical protein
MKILRILQGNRPGRSPTVKTTVRFRQYWESKSGQPLARQVLCHSIHKPFFALVFFCRVWSPLSHVPPPHSWGPLLIASRTAGNTGSLSHLVCFHFIKFAPSLFFITIFFFCFLSFYFPAHFLKRK